MSRSQAVIISKETITATFLYIKANDAKFHVAKNMSRSAKGHYLNKL